MASGARSNGLVSRLVTYKTAAYAALVVLIGIGFLYGSNLAWFEHRQTAEATVDQLGGILVTTGGLAILWDLRGKRDIIDEVLEKTKIASDVSSAGLERVTMSWLDVPWDDLFGHTKEIRVFISYGSSWRKVHWPKLQEFAKDKKNSLHMYLPDPDHEPTMHILAIRYDYTIEKIQASIRETAEELAKLGSGNPADIRIYYRAGDPTYTSYYFGDRVLVTLYSHKRERSDVPTLLVKQGTLRDFFKEDLKFIHRQSRPVAPTELLSGKATL